MLFRFVIHQTAPLNFSTVRRSHISMPDQRALFRLITRNISQLTSTYMIRVTPATLSPKPIAYDKSINPSEMPRISTCTEMTTEDTTVPTQDDKYP